jgi:Uma2 family endonuclease
MEITSLSQLDLTKQYTYADYVLWKFSERVELLKGYLRQMAAPSRKHQTVSFRLGLTLGNFFKGHTCQIFHAPFDVRLPKKNPIGTKPKDIYTVVQPDICVICDLSKLDDAGCLGSPDLIVEILSPSNTKTDLFDKYKIYEEAGVKEYWIANPMENLIQQFILNDIIHKYELINVVTTTEELTSHFFPMLVVNVAEIFED